MIAALDSFGSGVASEDPARLTPEQRGVLLDVARKAVQLAAAWEEADNPSSDDPDLTRPSGAFVTLRRPDGSLRGCIGFTVSHLPLIETVALAGHAAASRDPRFSPVREEEVDDLGIEISVLSLPRRIHSEEEVEIGRHGLVVTQGRNRGLLLPQVAVEHRWTSRRFLEETCRKAGIGGDQWRNPAAILEVFTAEVFGEKS